MLSWKTKSTTGMQTGTDEQMSTENNDGCCREYKRKLTPSRPGGLMVAAGSAVSLLATVPGLRSLHTSAAVAWRSGRCSADG